MYITTGIVRFMSNFSDREDRMLIQLVHQHTVLKGNMIPWKDIVKIMRSRRSPEQLRLRVSCLKKRFGNVLPNFPRWYFMKPASRKSQQPKLLQPQEEGKSEEPDPEPTNTKTAYDEHQIWKLRLVEAYSVIRRGQKIADKLVLGHQHMYAELTRASLVQVFEILKLKCDLDSNSVFADLGCGLGKVVFLASMCGVKQSIGVEVVPQHLENARNSMKKLKAENIELIEGDIKDNLHKLDMVTHLYAFDFVFSDETMSVIYDFLRMHKGMHMVSFRKPNEMLNHRLNVKVIEILKGKMTHVSESHNCYVYKIV